MNKTVTESIYSDDNVIVPMADVSHVEKYAHTGDICVHFKHSKWNRETDSYDPVVVINGANVQKFISAWTMYRHELEIETLVELQP